jgi:hypothetical protein
VSYVNSLAVMSSDGEGYDSDPPRWDLTTFLVGPTLSADQWAQLFSSFISRNPASNQQWFRYPRSMIEGVLLNHSPVLLHPLLNAIFTTQSWQLQEGAMNLNSFALFTDVTDRGQDYCVLCHRTFITPYKTRVHIRIVHFGNAAYSCSRCEQKFFRSTDRDQHLRVHDRTPHTCEVCGTVFAHARNRARHRRTVHPPVAGD